MVGSNIEGVSPFRLDATFLASYKQRRPEFGFGALGELVYLRTYSRLKDDGTNEQWWETVRRVVEGTYSMQKRWILANRLGWSESKAQRSAQEMYERMFTMKFLPPGRGLWAMGSPLTEERGLFAALNNCAFVSTNNLVDDLADPFVFLMDASMLGIGVGFDTKGAGTTTVYEPSGVLAAGTLSNGMHYYQKTPGTWEYTVPDNREGWVESLRLLMLSYLTPNMQAVVFDYSQIRPEGQPIKGFGGVAAGPAPLRDMHNHIRRILNRRIGSTMTSTDIVDIMNLIGKCVVAGNVRRSAEIAFGNPSDAEFLQLKDPTINPERCGRADWQDPTKDGWAWTSNNSIFAELGMDYSVVAAQTAVNGEPGYAWLDNMREFGRMIDPPNNVDHRAMGGNPCLEQTLESYELCCLVETFPARHESLQDYLRTLKFAYLYAKTVTLGNTPWARTNQVLLRNRRIGLSQSGIVQAIHKLGIEEYRHWCEEGYDTVQYYDSLYSDWLVIPRSIKTTSVKPSGTVSLLAGATPGMHFPEYDYYIRRMRLSKNSELVPRLIEAGYHVEPCVGDASSSVVEIPVALEEGLRTVGKVSMWEQLALAAFLQRYWADNQVSCTVTFQPHEGPQIEHALAFYQYQLKGISFLPQLEGGAYEQMPYESISAETYAAKIARVQPVNFSQTHEEAEQERFCDGQSCAIN
jgi:ribonucleoside-triphosphate reductase